MAEAKLKKTLLASAAALFLAAGTAHAEEENMPNGWWLNGHSCQIQKFVEGEDTGVITPKDIPDIERELKALKACDRFYQCVAERDGYIKPRGKRPKHCYATDKRWR